MEVIFVLQSTSHKGTRLSCYSSVYIIFDVFGMNDMSCVQKGDKNEIANYRGVAIKVNLKKNYLKAFCINISLYINDKQHGFINSRSTCTNLAQFTQFVLNALDKKLQVDVIYTDLSKVFDIFDLNMLLIKLKKCNL